MYIYRFAELLQYFNRIQSIQNAAPVTETICSDYFLWKEKCKMQGHKKAEKMPKSRAVS